MTWSRETFAKNLLRYMNVRNVTQKELAEVVGVSTPTVNDWVKAKKYPRIDRIELMADYFGILKSDLIEDKNEQREGMQKKAGIIADATLRMKVDKEFLELVETLMNLDTEKLDSVKQLVAFMK